MLNYYETGLTTRCVQQILHETYGADGRLPSKLLVCLIAK